MNHKNREGKNSRVSEAEGKSCRQRMASDPNRIRLHRAGSAFQLLLLISRSSMFLVSYQRAAI